MRNDKLTRSFDLHTSLHKKERLQQLKIQKTQRIVDPKISRFLGVPLLSGTNEVKRNSGSGTPFPKEDALLYLFFWRVAFVKNYIYRGKKKKDNFPPKQKTWGKS